MTDGYKKWKADWLATQHQLQATVEALVTAAKHRRIRIKPNTEIEDRDKALRDLREVFNRLRNATNLISGEIF